MQSSRNVQLGNRHFVARDQTLITACNNFESASNGYHLANSTGTSPAAKDNNLCRSNEFAYGKIAHKNYIHELGKHHAHNIMHRVQDESKHCTM